MCIKWGEATASVYVANQATERLVCVTLRKGLKLFQVERFVNFSILCKWLIPMASRAIDSRFNGRA